MMSGLPRHRGVRAPGVALFLGLLVPALGLADPGPSIDDPRYLRATMLLDGGDPGGAIAPLEAMVAERAGALYVQREHFDDERERGERLRDELGILHRKLAIAEDRRGESAAALRHLQQVLDLDPGARLDPLEASRALMLKFEELREQASASEDPTTIELPDAASDGIEHSPPLVVVRGTEAALYARVEGGREGRVVLFHCAVPRRARGDSGAPCSAPRRREMEAVRGSLFATSIPAAHGLEARELRYRIERLDEGGRRHSTPWFRLAIASDINQHTAAARERYGPRAEARLRQSRVVQRLSPPAPWPEGVREIDSRGGSLERYREPY